MPAGPRILAVDDDEGILYTLRAIAEVAGWEATTASKPGDVLGLLDAGARFDVIVVDYHMPDMDGVALVRAIRQRDPSVPVVVLTVDERLALAERFREAGADDFAVKPIKAADFISRIRVHLTPVKRTAYAPHSQGGDASRGRSGSESGSRSASANGSASASASGSAGASGGGSVSGSGSGGAGSGGPGGPQGSGGHRAEHASTRQELPKGLSVQTMELVLKALRDVPHGRWVGADAIATRAGIAYQTVWRYLEALEREGRVEVSLDYGTRGRPPKRYRLRPGI